MARGRKQFQKYKPLIEMTCHFFGLLPKGVQKKLLVKYRKTTGNCGLVLRYALLKNIAGSIGDNVSIQPDVYLFNVENLFIGDNVSIHPMCYIEAYGGVTIGNDVSIAHGTTIMSVTHKYADTTVPIKDQGLTAQPVIISDNTWIGAKVTVLGNITIGTGVVLGASTVVTRDIPPNSVAVGVPARVIKERSI